MRSVEIAALLQSGKARAAGEALHDALISLHGSGETRELLALHRLAAQYWQADPAQAAFHLTHAYVYALESGDEEAARELHDTLKAEGRI